MAPGLAMRAWRAAEELAAARPTSTPSDLARELGIEIVEAPAPSPAQALLRSEYTADPPRIILYERTIRAVFARLQSTSYGVRSCAELRELHVAHELFHHLEMDGRFGSLTGEESEKAAHVFARHLCGLGAYECEAVDAQQLSVAPWISGHRGAGSHPAGRRTGS
jgi:hypothetical protein